MKANRSMMDMIRSTELVRLLSIRVLNVDETDIRHLALQTVLPLLSQPTVYSYARTLMPPIYSQLDQDPPITVFRVLTAIWDAITLSSPGVSRRISLALVNESSVEFLIRLLGRSDLEMKSGQKVGDMVKGFLEGVSTNPGRGICFADEGWYPRELDAKARDDEEGDRGNLQDKEKKRLHNRILANVIRKLGARVIDDDGKLGDLVTQIVQACPELVAGYVVSLLGDRPVADPQVLGSFRFGCRSKTQRSMDGYDGIHWWNHLPPSTNHVDFQAPSSKRFRGNHAIPNRPTRRIDNHRIDPPLSTTQELLDQRPSTSRQPG
jgi:hypothetical protein